jgi:PAS domain S-box-containing protein
MINLRAILSKYDRALSIWLKSSNFSQKALDAFFTSAPAGIVILDSNLRIVKANVKMAEMVELPLADIIGKTARGAAPLLANRIEPFLRRVSTTGKPVLNFSMAGKARKGQKGMRQWVASVFPIYPEAKGRWYVGAIAVEVTEEAYFERLRKSEALLAAAEQIGQMGCWEHDLDSGKDIWSANLCRLLGVDPTKTKLSEDLFWQLLHPDDHNAVRTVIQGGMKDGQEYEYQSRFITPGGHERTFYTHGKPILGLDNRVIKRMGMTQDISARVEIERAVLASEKSLSLFRELIDRSNDAIEVVDPVTLRFLDVNERACTDLGYTREEILKMTVFDIDPTVNEASTGKVIEALNQSGSLIMEGVHRRKDGSTFPVEVNINLVHLDRSYVVTVVRDTTERKRAEDALRESEARLRLATQAGRMYAFEWDVATDVVVRSEECKDILGVEEPTRITRRELFEAVHPEDRQSWDITALTPGNPNGSIRYRILRRDGSTIWVQKTARAFFDESGKMIRMIGMVADVTERKQAEDTLRVLSAKLINVQDEERRQVAMELHETLAQDLAALKLRLGYLKRLTRKDNKRITRAINESVQMNDDLIKQVRTLSYTLHPPLLDEVGLPMAIATYVSTFSEHSGIEVSTQIDLPEEMGRLPHQYELTLFRVIQECLSNVHLHSRSPVATIALQYETDRLILEVADRGQGMLRISDGILMNAAKGIGIASMRERVKQLRGTLFINSEDGRGVKVRVVLPVPKDESKHTYERGNLLNRNVSHFVGG